MKSISAVFEMARMTKAMIKNEKDELLYRAQSFREKAGRLRRAGRTEEAQRALEESERYKQLAAEWKPKEEFDTVETPKYEVKWQRSTMFTRPIFGTSGTYTFRELWTERFEDLDLHLDLKVYIGKKLKDWNNDKRYAPQDMMALCDILEDRGHQKTKGDFISYGYKKVDTVKIEILKSDWYKWRYQGETEWRELPTVKR